MANNAEIFFEHDRWGHNVAWSVALHVLVAGCIVLYAVLRAADIAIPGESAAPAKPWA
jgi:hypothetical protein